MTSDVIPSDITEINEQIEELLTITPPTSERGRLFHLIKAALDHGAANAGGAQPPFFLGRFTVQAATATNTEVSAAGGIALMQGTQNTLRFSYLNTDSLDINTVFDALSPVMTVWQLGFHDPDTDFTQQTTGSIVTSTQIGDSGINTFALADDFSGAFTAGTEIEVFLRAQSSGGSSSEPFNGTFNLGMYTWQNNFDDETEDGNISFNDGYIQIRSVNTAGDDFQTLLQHGISDGWRLRISDSGGTTTVELNTVDYETSDDYLFANLPTDSGLETITNGTAVAVTLLLPTGRPFKNFGQLLYPNYTVNSVTSTASTPSEGEILLNNANPSNVTSIRAHYALSNIPLRAKLTRLTTSDTIGIVNNNQVQYYSISAVSDNSVGEFVTLTVAAVTGDFLGNIATSDRLGLVKI